MAVLIEDEVVQNDHLVYCVLDILDAKGLTAVEIVPVQGSAVVPFHGAHDAPCADEFCIRGDEILTHTVRHTFIPEQGIGNMGNTQVLRDQGSNDLIKRLLHEGIAASF